MCPLSGEGKCGGVLQRTGIDGWDVCRLENVDRKWRDLFTLRRVVWECGQKMEGFVHSPEGGMGVWTTNVEICPLSGVGRVKGEG